MFWVISVQFDLRNTLPKSGTFLLGHPVYVLSVFVLGIAIVNAAPAITNLDPLVFKLSDIFCVNESEVCITDAAGTLFYWYEIQPQYKFITESEKQCFVSQVYIVVHYFHKALKM